MRRRLTVDFVLTAMRRRIQYGDMTKRKVVTLRVTAEGFGTRLATWRGPNAVKVATYYEWLWRKEGHNVEWV